MRMFNIFNLSI